jgi:hypothetical protein
VANERLQRKLTAILSADLGLRNVEGMPTASMRHILETAKNVIDRLAAPPDDLDLKASRALMQRLFAINNLGDLATPLNDSQERVVEARAIVAAQIQQ